MPSITIRDVSEATRDELASRAARSGRSLQEYLLAELGQLAVRPDPEVLLQRIRERKRLTNSTVAVDRILEHQGADRV